MNSSTDNHVICRKSKRGIQPHADDKQRPIVIFKREGSHSELVQGRVPILLPVEDVAANIMWERCRMLAPNGSGQERRKCVQPDLRNDIAVGDLRKSLGELIHAKALVEKHPLPALCRKAFLEVGNDRHEMHVASAPIASVGRRRVHEDARRLVQNDVW